MSNIYNKYKHKNSKVKKFDDQESKALLFYFEKHQKVRRCRNFHVLNWFQQVLRFRNTRKSNKCCFFLRNAEVCQTHVKECRWSIVCWERKSSVSLLSASTVCVVCLVAASEKSIIILI